MLKKTTERGNIKAFIFCSLFDCYLDMINKTVFKEKNISTVLCQKRKLAYTTIDIV